MLISDTINPFAHDSSAAPEAPNDDDSFHRLVGEMEGGKKEQDIKAKL